MRSALALSALAGLLVLPAPVAFACGGHEGGVELSDPVVVPGGSLRVTGDANQGPSCWHAGPAPEETETPSSVVPTALPGLPTPTALPGLPAPTTLPAPAVVATAPVTAPVAPATPPATAPAPRAVPAAAPTHAGAKTVRIVLRQGRVGYGGDVPHTHLATVAPATSVPLGEGWHRHRFAATVRIPRSVAPGRYVIEAEQRGVVWFGAHAVRVVTELPATGAPVGDLTRLGLLAILAGAGAVVAARRGDRAPA